MNTKYIFEYTDTKIAILITIIYCLSVSFVTINFNPFLTNEDVVFYYFPGKQILDGNGEDVVIPNAPFTTAILFALTDDPYTHTKIISILSSTGIVILSYMITKQILNSRVAIITTIIMAVNAGLHMNSYIQVTEIFPIFLLFLSFYFITKRELDSKKIFLVVTFLGLSFILKYPAGIIGIAFLIFFLIYTKPRFKNAGLFLIICLLIVSPLLIFNYITTGSIITSNSSTLVLMEWKNIPDEWYQIESYNDSLLFLKDVNILFVNFSNQLSYNIFNTILNVKLNWNNLSVFPMIPFIGSIPLFGGIYLLRKSIPKNMMPFIIAFVIYLPILSIFASITNTIRLFPPALILLILPALFFSKINKKHLLIPILIFIVFVNLGASVLMANWHLFDNSSIYFWKDEFWKNNGFHNQELYHIGQLLSREEDIESKYLMARSNLVAYHAHSKFISLYEPLLNNNLGEHMTRKNWSQFNTYVSNYYSHPQIKTTILEQKPDYLLIEPQDNVPENWIVLYQSENYVLYKIPK